MAAKSGDLPKEERRHPNPFVLAPPPLNCKPTQKSSRNALWLNDLDVQVLVGVPEGMEGKALSLAGDIRAGLIRVNAAIDAKSASLTFTSSCWIGQLPILTREGLYLGCMAPS